MGKNRAWKIKANTFTHFPNEFVNYLVEFAITPCVGEKLRRLQLPNFFSSVLSWRDKCSRESSKNLGFGEERRLDSGERLSIERKVERTFETFRFVFVFLRCEYCEKLWWRGEEWRCEYGGVRTEESKLAPPQPSVSMEDGMAMTDDFCLIYDFCFGKFLFSWFQGFHRIKDFMNDRWSRN